jgi:hypothetical protein
MSQCHSILRRRFTSGGAAFCSAKPATDCPVIPVDFNCVQEGILPDPLNCNRYYYCDLQDSGKFKAQQLSCPDGYAFEPTLPDIFPCIYTANNVESCITSNCNNTAFGAISVMRYASLPSNLSRGQIAVKCFGSLGKPVVYKTIPYVALASVDDDLVPRYNIICPYEGYKLPDTANPNNYYVCVRDKNNQIISSKSFTCFAGKRYNKCKQICETPKV